MMMVSEEEAEDERNFFLNEKKKTLLSLLSFFLTWITRSTKNTSGGNVSMATDLMGASGAKGSTLCVYFFSHGKRKRRRRKG